MVLSQIILAFFRFVIFLFDGFRSIFRFVIFLFDGFRFYFIRVRTVNIFFLGQFLRNADGHFLSFRRLLGEFGIRTGDIQQGLKLIVEPLRISVDPRCADQQFGIGKNDFWIDQAQSGEVFKIIRIEAAAENFRVGHPHEISSCGTFSQQFRQQCGSDLTGAGFFRQIVRIFSGFQFQTDAGRFWKMKTEHHAFRCGCNRRSTLHHDGDAVDRAVDGGIPVGFLRTDEFQVHRPCCLHPGPGIFFSSGFPFFVRAGISCLTGGGTQPGVDNNDDRPDSQYDKYDDQTGHYPTPSCGSSIQRFKAR